MGFAISRRIVTGFTVILVLVVASISSAIILASLQSHEVTHGGTPIDETTFAGLVADYPGPSVYPGAPLVVTSNAVRLTLDYSNSTPVITLNESINIALSFYSKFSYLSGLNFTPDPVWNNHDVDYYTLRFFHDDIEMYTAVSSITGMIRSFAPSRLLISSFDKTPQTVQLLRDEEIEIKAFTFLSEHNYSLSPYTRYEGPTLTNDEIFVGFWVYELRFFCVINGSMIAGNWCTLSLDIETGEILRFSYRWFDITSLPVDGIISAREAEQVTLEALATEKGATGMYVAKSQLWFKPVSSYPLQEYWLCWIVDIQHPQWAGAIINAKGGWVLDYSFRAI